MGNLIENSLYQGCVVLQFFIFRDVGKQVDNVMMLLYKATSVVEAC